MRRHVYYSQELKDDGPEIRFEYKPIEGTLLQAKVADRYVVAYLVYDEFGCNPLKDYEGGDLITDGNACVHLGFEELGGRFHDANKDYELDGIEERVAAKIAKLLAENEELRAWFVKVRLELDEDPMSYIVETVHDEYTDIEWSDEDREMLCLLPSWKTLAEEAWDELYAEGKIGTHLAVPVNYCDSCHGPGTTQISTTDIDNANAVWIPGENEIDNMDFTDCKTYTDKLKVATKYAQSCLDEYEKWCNGEIYGCICHVYNEEGEILEDEGGEECWGFIGAKYAEEVLEEEFFKPVCKRVQSRYDEDVRTGSGHQMEMVL